MKFREIENAMKLHQGLVGKVINGARVDELVPVPVNAEDAFWRCYVRSEDAEEAMVRLFKQKGFAQEEEYRIDAVLDKGKITSEHVLVHVNVEYVDGLGAVPSECIKRVQL